MKEYRTSKNRDEIIRQVQKKFLAKEVVTVWQRDMLTGERNFKCQVKFYSVDIENGTFIVQFASDDVVAFKPNLETYFLLQDLDFAFKTKLGIDQPKDYSLINFRIPADVKLQELRLHPRLYIPLSEKRFARAKFKARKKNGQHVLVTCPILNISKGGVCLIVSKSTLNSIDMQAEVWLEGVSFYEPLERVNRIRAIARNLRIYTKEELGHDETFAIGLEFLDKIPPPKIK